MSEQFGGIVVDRHRQVLLYRSPYSYGPHCWEFPRGYTTSSTEAPEEAALRTVTQNTAVVAEIVARIPGAFGPRPKPGASDDRTIYWLMRPVGASFFGRVAPAEMCWERLETVPRVLRSQPAGSPRRYDLAALRAAAALLSQLTGQ